MRLNEYKLKSANVNIPYTPDEIADSVGFLLSPAAKAITGINLPVDAGWLAGSTWQTYGGVPPAHTSTTGGR